MPMQEERTRSVMECCRLAETTIRKVQRLMLEPRPGVLDRCQIELQQVIHALDALVSEASRPKNPAVQSSFGRIQDAARALRLQIEYASNFCLGWIQLRLGTGYTERGLPVLEPGEARSSFEG
jgi:hypothetical protein